MTKVAPRRAKDCPDGCPFGEVCIDDICQVTTECASDDDCAEGICVENEVLCRWLPYQR